MDLGLEGNVVIVTGGSRGIGYATASVLAQEGAQPVICARDEDTLRRAASAIEDQSGREVSYLAGDVSDPSFRERLVAWTVETHGTVHGLVSNVSAGSRYEEDELWEAVFRTDVLGGVHLIDLVSPYMVETGRGSIVLISSASAKIGHGWGHGYGALKAALIAAGKSYARRLAPDGVRVNVVAPGSIYVPGGEWDRWRELDPEMVARVESNIPMGRMGSPEEVARCIVFVLSDAAHWVVGHCLLVDGGQYPATA